MILGKPYLLLTVIFLGACAAAPGQEEAPLPAMPSSVEQGLAVIEASAPCAEKQDFKVRKLRNPESTRPIVSEVCVPEFPEVLMQRGYNAACLASFRLGSDGIAQDISTICNTRNLSGFNDAAQLEIADAMFERAMARIISETQYAPADPETGFDTTEFITQPLKFAYEDMIDVVDYPKGMEFDTIND